MEITTKIVKSGRFLLARIPAKEMEKVSRGDIVKIVILEKRGDLKNIDEKVKQFIEKPSNEKLKGKIMGFSVEIPIAKIINNMAKNKAKKFIVEVLGVNL